VEKDVTGAGRSFEAIRADFADPAAVRGLGESLARRDRPVDILVNNAGTIRRPGRRDRLPGLRRRGLRPRRDPAGRRRMARPVSGIAGTAVELTGLGFGASVIGNLYRETTPADAADAVAAAWNAGIRYFDTAPHYGLGLSERRLGEALRGYPRDSFVVSSKVGRLLVDNPSPRGTDPEGLAVPDHLQRRWDSAATGSCAASTPPSPAPASPGWTSSTCTTRTTTGGMPPARPCPPSPGCGPPCAPRASCAPVRPRQ
jgi:hypothetical protein